MSDKVVRVIGWIAGFLVAAFLFGRLGDGNDIEMDPADLEQRGASSTTAQILARHLNRFGDSLRKLPAFKEAIEEAESEEAAFQATAALSLEGLAHLSPTAVDSFARLKLSLMESLSKSECARMSRSQLDRNEILSIYGRVDTVSLKRMLSLNSRSSLARLSRGPAPQPSEAELRQAWTAFVESLGSTKEERFNTIVDAASPSDEQQCWVETQIWESLPKLPPDEKMVFVRLLTLQADGG